MASRKEVSGDSLAASTVNGVIRGSAPLRSADLHQAGRAHASCKLCFTTWREALSPDAHALRPHLLGHRLHHLKGKPAATCSAVQGVASAASGRPATAPCAMTPSNGAACACVGPPAAPLNAPPVAVCALVHARLGELVNQVPVGCVELQGAGAKTAVARLRTQQLRATHDACVSACPRNHHANCAHARSSRPADAHAPPRLENQRQWRSARSAGMLRSSA